MPSELRSGNADPILMRAMAALARPGLRPAALRPSFTDVRDMVDAAAVMTRDCFESGFVSLVLALEAGRAAFAPGLAAVEDKAGFLRADAIIGILHFARFTAVSRRITDPTSAIKPAGQDSKAPVALGFQSFWMTILLFLPAVVRFRPCPTTLQPHA